MASRRHYDYNRKLVLKGLKFKDLFLNLISFFLFDFLRSDGIYFKIFIPLNINIFQQVFA